MSLAFDIRQSFKLNQSGDTVAGKYDSPGTLISLIINNLFVIAGIILFFTIIIAGLNMILNAGNADKTAQGGKTIANALLGLAVLFTSYWIIRIIEGLTELQILNPVF